MVRRTEVSLRWVLMGRLGRFTRTRMSTAPAAMNAVFGLSVRVSV